ncbi:MAG: response regulator [Candidatus Marinimicrobia bacterium]|nr:response regulator [Candidatus Neomarinimicrobiota bacterium]
MAKILIVDDDYDFVSGVKTVLESADHEVTAAYSREEGMKLFEQEEPDLIILDVMMDEPDDGFTMAQDLKRKHAKASVLMLSSVGQVTGLEFDKDDEMVPVDAFEEKPIMPNKLLEKVKELLNN